jgi:hypothetical protein
VLFFAHDKDRAGAVRTTRSVVLPMQKVSTSVAVGGDRDQIRIQVAGGFGDLMRGQAGADRCLDGA